ncbi:unnamed protein product [Phytophthora fragariaefolia]|uniref:Unnamed protein product n=1 Tax=Phytophthora fragariaefolia TaxID=1490495 RepID=A0A9W6Y036_9STRA|nr:unnamed protein product [Phytophthora fragariaefolia]
MFCPASTLRGMHTVLVNNNSSRNSVVRVSPGSTVHWHVSIPYRDRSQLETIDRSEVETGTTLGYINNYKSCMLLLSGSKMKGSTSGLDLALPVSTFHMQ